VDQALEASTSPRTASPTAESEETSPPIKERRSSAGQAEEDDTEKEIKPEDVKLTDGTGVFYHVIYTFL